MDNASTQDPPMEPAADAVDGADHDSAFGDAETGDDVSMTFTLGSEIDYVYENGRRYMSNRMGQYWGPNDEQQANSIDIGHQLFKLILDERLFLAPIDPNSRRALDVGTGTGIWAIDFADKYPDCQIIGTDLSPTQPREVPPNLHFEIDDACSPWTFTKESFDYIHMRGMYGSVDNWPDMYREVYRHLKPGGWFEQLEVGVVPKSDDGTIAPDSIYAQWGHVSLAAGDAFGRTLRVVDEMRDNITNAGFEAVTEHRFKIPLNPWPKEPRLKQIGLFNLHYWNQGLEGYCMLLLTRYLGWSKEEVMVYVAKMRAMLKNRSVHAYNDCTVVYARKPLVPRSA